jgi:hypothetical protein
VVPEIRPGSRTCGLADLMHVPVVGLTAMTTRREAYRSPDLTLIETEPYVRFALIF